MAKKMKKTLAMVLVLCMMVSMMSVSVFAADVTTETESETVDGVTTETTTTTTTEIDENGNTTVVVKIEKDVNGTDSEGVTVNGEETYTETTVTDENGNELQNHWEVDGKETKEWSEEDQGNEPGQTPVEVPLVPGETTTGTVTETVEETTEDGTTTTTTTDRTVEATTSDIVVTEEEKLDFDMKGLAVEKKEDAVDLKWSAGAPMYGQYYDKITFGDEIRYVPRFNRTEDQMAPELKEYYDKVTEQVLDDDGNVVEEKVIYKPKVTSGKSNISNTHGEFVVLNVGDDSPYKIYYEDGTTGTGCTIALVDKFGKMLVSYCMDNDTGTSGNVPYIMENIQDADYFKGTEEEQQAAKNQVRAIALKGYWGTTSGTGSLDQIKKELEQFIEDNPDFTFTYTDPNPEEGEAATKQFSVANDKEYLLALIQHLNEAGAVSVTQSAIWEFGNRTSNPEFVHNNKANVEPEFNYALAMLRSYLLDPKLQETVEAKDTVIYDETSFLDKDSLKLTVGDKIQDNGGTEDVYNCDMSFALVVTPGEKDDLIVCLVDSDGNIIRKARIAGEALEGESSDEIVKGEDGSYTFENIPMQEGSDITFNLKLEGVQYLEQGVYIYKHVKADGSSDYDTKQTLVGVAEGTHEVDVTSAFTVNFTVDEDNHVVVERVWHDEGDPNNEPPTPFNFTPPPPAPPEIPDEEVPLADAPQTGDEVIYFAVLAVLAGFGLAAMHVSDMKRKAEEN